MATMITVIDSKSANLALEDLNTQKVKEFDEESGHVLDNKDVDDKGKPAADAQQGVQKIEAVTLAWGRGSLYAILVL